MQAPQSQLAMAPTTTNKHARPDDDVVAEPSTAKKARTEPESTTTKSTRPHKVTKATKTDAELAAVREEAVKDSVTKNPPNVFVIAPKSWPDNSSRVAAYLGFTNMEQFRLFFIGQGNSTESTSTHTLLDNYCAVRRNNYGKAIMGVKGSGSAQNVSVTNVWNLLTENSQESRQLLRADINVPLPKEVRAVYNVDNKSKEYPVAIHVAAMVHLIQHNPAIFQESHKTGIKLHTVGETGLAAEDLYRAWVLLKFYHRQMEKDQGKGFFAKEQSKMPAPAPIEFFSSEELTKVQLKGAEVLDGDAQQRAPGVAINELFRHAFLEEDDDPAASNFPTDADDVDEFMETVATQFETNVMTAQKAAYRWSTPGKAVMRNPLTEDQMRQACYYIGQQCRVKHDDPSMGDAATAPGSTTDAPALDGHAQVSRQTKVWPSPPLRSDFSLPPSPTLPRPLMR